MPAILIDDLALPELAPYRNLKHHVRRGALDFIVESSMVIERLLDSRYEVLSLLLTPQRYQSLQGKIPHDVPVFLAERALISELAGFDVHRGCLARASAPKNTESLGATLAQLSPRRILILEGLADPANIGTIIRNAAAFGVELIIADPNGASPFSRRAARTSAGCLFQIPVLECSPIEAISAIRMHLPECEIVAATPAAEAAPLNLYRPKDQLALLVGNEGTGLSQQALEAADQAVRIPMAPGIDSLNAAASVAVFLYALMYGVSR